MQSASLPVLLIFFLLRLPLSSVYAFRLIYMFLPICLGAPVWKRAPMRFAGSICGVALPVCKDNRRK